MIQIRRNNIDELVEKHYKGILNHIETKWKKNTLVSDFLQNHTTLKEIITGNPDELQTIIDKIPEKEVAELSSEIKKVFYYEGFKKWSDYGAYHLANGLQVNVCPYCNRQFTFTIIEKGKDKGKVRPEFDHFFSQSKYPYLALSFYNLIPSCHICNSTLKGSKEFSLKTHIHPYLDEFGKDCKFSLKLKMGKGIDFFYGKKDSFEITFNHNQNKRIQNNINDFSLKLIYNEHKDYVSEIIQKSTAYTDSYMNSLFNQFEGTLFSSVGDVQKMVMSNYISEEDLDKRVLAKWWFRSI